MRPDAGRLATIPLKPFGLVLGLLGLLVLPLRAEPEKRPEGADQAPAAMPAQQPAGPENERRLGKFLRINAPITDKVDQRVRLVVDNTIKEAKKQGLWPVFVFEIQPGRSEFGKASDLAKFISSPALNGATTVAYIPETVTGHSVLVAMACDEIIMAEGAEIGEAGKFEPVIEPSVRNAYVEIANRRKTIPADLALGMLDQALEVLVVETDVGREIILSSKLEELKQTKAIKSTKVLKAAGSPGLITGAKARELGIASYLAANRGEVAKAWKLPPTAVADDLSLEGQWKSVRLFFKGPLTPDAINKAQSLIDSQIREHNVNFICLWIDSPGGALTESRNLANFLDTLDPSQRRTVAYIPGEARGDAALIALACDHIVMHPGAVIGGPGAAPFSPEDVRLTVPAMEDIARKRFRSPALVAAMIDPNLPVFRCTRKSDGLVDYFAEAEFEKLPNRGDWRKDDEVSTRGSALRCDGKQAEELGIATTLVNDFAEFKVHYGLEHDPQLIEPTWATVLIDALNSPGVAWFLLFLGGAALYAELQSPGIGLGGIVAAMCFLLYFWSAYLGGTAGWLEVILFLFGVMCLLLEVFVFPGVAIFGLTGGLLVVVSLVLASQTFVLPHNEYQMAHLRTTLSVVVGAGAAALVAALLMNRLLPHTPMFNRMLLAPPTGEELSHISRREALAEFDHLVGTQGTAATPLLPAGKALIGDQLIDVIAAGEFIEKGQTVVVTEAKGNRVLVRGVG